ncbi:MAG: amidohydrolase family protein [Phycisphaeraceae bacterium]
MTRLLIENVRALRPNVGVVGRSVLVEAGRIVGIDPGAAEGAHRVDGDGRLLTPGLMDVHAHGLGHHLFEAGPDALAAGLKLAPRFGVTCMLPTMYRVMDRASLPGLARLAEAIGAVTAVRVPGFHLEGPFLALPGAGAETVAGDVALLDALFEATGGRIAAMSVSPDTPDVLPVIERLVERGVAVFLTHTQATVEQTQAAIDAGARHATHFYDVFPVPAQAEPGVRPAGAVEAIMADERVSVDFIADGVHVHPMAIRAALAAKGVGRTLLITDANIGAGLPAGVHESPWGFALRVAEGDGARMHTPGGTNDGELAGSALTMEFGMSNLLRWIDRPEHEVWAMGTRSVAERMGWPDLGDLREGAAADLVLWDRAADGRLRANKTWLAGRLVFDAAAATVEVARE